MPKINTIQFDFRQSKLFTKWISSSLFINALKFLLLTTQTGMHFVEVENKQGKYWYRNVILIAYGAYRSFSESRSRVAVDKCFIDFLDFPAHKVHTCVALSLLYKGVVKMQGVMFKQRFIVHLEMILERHFFESTIKIYIFNIAFVPNMVRMKR